MPPTRRRIQLTPGGPEKDAVLIEVQQCSEHWNQYLLGDGTVVKMKTVVTPSNVLSVNPPDELRRKG